MVIVILNPKETRMIRKICRIQLEVLRKILNNQAEEEDVPLFCLEHEMTELELKREVLRDMEVFENVYIDPSEFFLLEDDNLSIGKHILYNFFERRKDKDARRSIHRKIKVIENWDFAYN